MAEDGPVDATKFAIHSVNVQLEAIHPYPGINGSRSYAIDKHSDGIKSKLLSHCFTTKVINPNETTWLGFIGYAILRG